MSERRTIRLATGHQPPMEYLLYSILYRQMELSLPVMWYRLFLMEQTQRGQGCLLTDGIRGKSYNEGWEFNAPTYFDNSSHEDHWLPFLFLT